jgi:biopolymer transport protein ExbB
MNVLLAAAVLDAIRGGWEPALPVAVCSVLMMALAVERFRAFLPRVLWPSAVVDEVANLKRGLVPDPARVRAAALGHPGLVASLLTEALRQAGRPAAEVRAALEAVARRGLIRLKAPNTWLSYAGKIGPLLGLLGSVIGLITTFASLGTAGAAKAGQLSGGIAHALVATAGGVILAIIGETLAAFFNHKLALFVADLDERFSGVPEMVSRLSPPDADAAERGNASVVRRIDVVSSVNGHN